MACVCVLSVAAFGQLSCGSAPVIGVLLPTSGVAASYGESMKEAIELAIDEAKADGSYPSGLTIVWADSASDPATAAREFKVLADDNGAKMVIAGVTSGEARELLPLLEQTGTIVLSPSASAPSLTKDSKFFYRVFASDELEGRRAGRFLIEEQGKETVLIYAGATEHARGIEPPFRHVFEQAFSGKVVGKVELSNPGWEDDSADLLAAHNPDAVYIIAYAENTIQTLRHLRERGFSGLICVASSFYSGEVVAKNVDLVDGIYFPQPAFETTDPKPLTQRFVQSFQARFNHEPDIYAAHAYDAMRVAMQVVNIAPVMEAVEIKKAFQFGLDEFPGVTGIIQFDEYGDVPHNPIMFIVKNGQVLNYQTYLKEEKQRIRNEIIKLLGR
jgi:branched-chain amino acid transport system substrate-binding protein